MATIHELREQLRKDLAGCVGLTVTGVEHLETLGEIEVQFAGGRVLSIGAQNTELEVGVVVPAGQEYPPAVGRLDRVIMQYQCPDVHGECPGDLVADTVAELEQLRDARKKAAELAALLEQTLRPAPALLFGAPCRESEEERSHAEAWWRR